MNIKGEYMSGDIKDEYMSGEFKGWVPLRAHFSAEKNHVDLQQVYAG